MTLLRIFRIPNLFILGSTMCILSFGYIYPSLKSQDILPVMGTKDFFLFIFIVICIAAAGYLHNDIVDQEVDLLNKEKTWISKLGGGFAYLIYISLVLLPLPFVLSLSIEIDKLEYFWLYPSAVISLFLYNRYLKRMPGPGNIMIGLLCGGSVAVLLLAETESLGSLQQTDAVLHAKLNFLVWSFAFFAFMVNVIRELIKDLEDMEGDKKTGHQTIPVVFGIGKSKLISIVLLFILFACIATSLSEFGWNLTTLVMASGLLFLPLVTIGYFVYMATEKEDFSTLSKYLKIYMLSGLVFLILLKKTYFFV